MSEISPIDDIRSTAEYRRHVAANLLSEFLDLLSRADILARWNGLPTAAAAEQIRKCCGSKRWAMEITKQRPFTEASRLFAAADRVWERLDREARLEAFCSHPKIGDVSAASSAWATAEQSGMGAADRETRDAMAAANREYEAKFGFLFIVCATGKSGGEMLALLRARLDNDQGTEMRQASEQQRQIMQLRLRKWLSQ